MAVPTYTTQFYSRHDVTDDFFVVPDGYIWVVTTVLGFIPGTAAPVNINLVDHDTLVTYVWLNYDSGDLLGNYWQWGGERLVLLPGARVDVHASAGADVTVCGYALTYDGP